MMENTRQPLPVDALLPEIVDRLTAGNRLVLRAAPGAGKTTRVPPALLDAGLAAGKQVLVLEPRRIAARAAAEFVATARGGRTGEEVGYRVRFEQRGGAATKLWFLTEGVLGRQLARDPFLDDVGVVVLDEFHERHLQGDVALAVIRELQETIRPDLKLVVMSATLDTAGLSTYLKGPAVVTSEGRAYPVTMRYEGRREGTPLAARVARAVSGVLAAGDDGGDVLVFLPGAAEIRRAATAIAPIAAKHDIVVMPLHGSLPLDAQQRALRRLERRKVVLSTNVAETSLTVAGVTVVIDSGLARMARFDSRHAINVLRVGPISQAAAEQRAGRAGRTAPGRCVRLWSESEHAERRRYETPEIERLDLSAILLELRAWGLRKVADFSWLDPPRSSAVERADRLLVQLGAVDAVSGGLTETGRRMLSVAAHPRLARLLVESERQGCLPLGALTAALVSERDICLGQPTSTGNQGHPAAGTSDLWLRVELFGAVEIAGFGTEACRARSLDHRAVLAVERARRQFLRARGSGATPAAPRVVRGGHARNEEEALRRCVFLGFADRLVRRRMAGSDRGVMVGGKGVTLAPSCIVREAELFVAVDVEAVAGQAEALVLLASAVDASWLAEMLPEALRVESSVDFDGEQERVARRTKELFYDLVLSERVTFDVDRTLASEVLTEAALRDPARATRMGDDEAGFLARLRFLARWCPDLVQADADALLREAITAIAVGRRSFSELRQASLLKTIQGLTRRADLDVMAREAPMEWALPSGRQAMIRYDDTERPTASARIQELFGLTATPRLAAGRVPLTIQLLAPNQRPMQITDDLQSFWQNTYPEVRRQLRGRYPKHPWPSDPISAEPTSRPQRRG